MLTRLREGTPDAADEAARRRSERRSPRGDRRCATRRRASSATPSESCGQSSGSTSRSSRARSWESSARRVAARPRCWSWSRGCDRRTPGHRGGRPHRPGRAARALRVHAAAGPSTSLALCRRQRIPGSSARRAAADTSARSGRGALRAARAGGLRGVAPGPALRRDAPAGRIPSYVDGGSAGAAARRAVRLARRDHQGGDAVLARRRARARQAHGPARHPRRRGGALPVRLGAGAQLPPGSRRRPDRGQRSAGRGSRRGRHLPRSSRSCGSGRCAPSRRRRDEQGAQTTSRRRRSSWSCSAPGSSPLAGT